MKAADYIARFLSDRGVRTVFGYQGGMVTHLIDALDRLDGMRYVQTYHEQTASFAAEGWSAASGLPGVAVATSGPGATNMLTGVADAYMDGVPSLFLTGQVNTYEGRGDQPIRQRGFQELDIVDMARPVTKLSECVTAAGELRHALERAWHVSRSGRPGPVLIDLPMNVQRAEVDPAAMRGYDPDAEEPRATPPDIPWDEITAALARSRRPMVLIGGGCTAAASEWARRHGLPTVCSLKGKGRADEAYDLHLGLLGSYGNRCANMSMHRVDLLLALGTRLDTRQTGARLEGFLPQATIVHVNIDAAELRGHRLTNRVAVAASVDDFLRGLDERGLALAVEADYVAWLRQLRATHSQAREVVDNRAPYLFVEALSDALPANAAVCTDVGQNQMWVAQSLHVRRGQLYVTSGGLAPMGFAVPAAAGVAFADPGRTVVAVAGDGGLHMSCQALLLLSQHRLNVKVVLLDNRSLGMITQFQRLYFGGRLTGTAEEGGYTTPDFRQLAEAYRLPYHALGVGDRRQMAQLIATPGPALIHCHIDGPTNVTPKLEYDHPIYDPSPHLES